MKIQFEKIYKEHTWEFGSGEGSLEKHTKGYRQFLQKFLFSNNIKSVVDFGCGDFQFSKLINWDSIQYKGIDIVESVINRNKNIHESINIRFYFSNNNFKNIPNADLLIVKDVLQHWSNQSIIEFLPIIKNYKFVLITNCVGVDPLHKTINNDIEDGSFRCLDLMKPPFSINAQEVYSFTNRIPKFLSLFSKKSLM